MTQTLNCGWNNRSQLELEEKLQVHLQLRKPEFLHRYIRSPIPKLATDHLLGCLPPFSYPSKTGPQPVQKYFCCCFYTSHGFIMPSPYLFYLRTGSYQQGLMLPLSSDKLTCFFPHYPCPACWHYKEGGREKPQTILSKFTAYRKILLGLVWKYWSPIPLTRKWVPAVWRRNSWSQRRFSPTSPLKSTELESDL